MGLTRRAMLGGGLSVALVAPARSAPVRLEAGALPGGGYGFNGASPGPMLRVAAGGNLALNLANRLETPTSLAFLGSRLPNLACGYAGLSGASVAVGVEQAIALAPTEPGFALYGAYGAPFAGGLYGALVIDEAAPPPVDLDAVVVISAGKANGAPLPLRLQAPPGGRARVRLANATPESLLTVQVDGAVANIVAIDGAPSELFAPLANTFPMAPTSRFELMLDLPATPGATVSFVSKEDKDRPLLQIEATGAPAAPKSPIIPLPASPRLPKEIPLERAQRVAVTISGAPERGFAISADARGEVAPLYQAKNGWSTRALFKAPRGTPVSLALLNRTAAAQTLRLEGHVARQLHALDDGWDPYWRDVLWIAPGKTLHAAFVADNPGKWPLAAASPEARAKGMQAWFEVA